MAKNLKNILELRLKIKIDVDKPIIKAYPNFCVYSSLGATILS